MDLTWAVPILAASFAVILKAAFDFWQIRATQAGIAAALAGEIDTYLEFLQVTVETQVFHTLVTATDADREAGLQAFTQRLPSGHPVFDKVADKLGFIGVDDARATSRFYNIVTSFRLVYENLGSEGFRKVKPEGQKHMLNFVSTMLDREMPIAHALSGRLKLRADEPWWRIIELPNSLKVWP